MPIILCVFRAAHKLILETLCNFDFHTYNKDTHTHIHSVYLKRDGTIFSVNAIKITAFTKSNSM